MLVRGRFESFVDLVCTRRCVRVSYSTPPYSACVRSAPSGPSGLRVGSCCTVRAPRAGGARCLGAKRMMRATRADDAMRVPLFPHEPNSSTAARHSHRGNVAIGFGYGRTFSWELSIITLWSFDKAVTAEEPSTSLIVLTDTPEALAPHRTALPRLLVQPFNLRILSSVWNISRTLRDNDAVWFRFLVQASYMASHCRHANLVLLFDLKDVLFQSSPFALAPSDADGRPLETLTSFTEAFPVRRGSWNHKAMAHFASSAKQRGPFATSVPSVSETIEIITSRRLLGLNSGLLLGPPHVVERHARALSNAVVALNLPASSGATGVDQGAHTLFVYGALHASLAAGDASGGAKKPPPHTVRPMYLNGTGPVLTLHMLSGDLYTCDSVDASAPGSGVFRLRSAKSREAFVMVHQWNRAPETYQRAVLCHHRHLLHLPRLRCGPRNVACRPYQPERVLVNQDEREIIHKLNFKKEVALGFCRSWRTGCVTPESERITLVHASRT